MQIQDMKINIQDLLDLNENCNVYCYDLDHRLVDVNAYLMNFLKQYGYQSKQDLYLKTLLTNTLSSLMHAKRTNLSFKQGRHINFLNKVAFKDTFVLLITIKTPTYDDNNKINGVFGISQIISTSVINIDNSIRLSDRERECISHLIKGKTTAQIASTLKSI